MPQQSSFAFMGYPREQALLSFGEKVLTVIWMNEIDSRLRYQLVSVDTEILLHALIGVDRASIRTEYTDVMRYEVQQLPKFRFLFADFFFRGFAFLNIETRSIPLDDVAVRIAKWHFPVEHPAVFSIRAADASFVFEDFSSREAGSPFGHNPLNVFGGNVSGPIPAGHFIQSDAEVFQPRLIEVIEVTVWPGRVNQRRNRVDEHLNI